MPRMTQIQRQSGDAVIDTKKFTMFPNWIFQTRLSPNTRSVYMTLLSFAWGKKRVVWPSVQVIAEKANVGVRTARNCLRELEKAGLITTTEPPHSGHNSNEYVLHEVSDQMIQRLTPANDADTPACGAAPPRQDMPPTPARGAAEVDKKKTEEKKTKGSTLAPLALVARQAVPGDHGVLQRGVDDGRGQVMPAVAPALAQPGERSGSPGDLRASYLGDDDIKDSLRYRLEHHR